MRHAGHEQIEQVEGNLIVAGVVVGAYVASSPFWLPRVLLHDDSNEAFFPRFPYDNTSGYLMSDAWLSGFTADKVLGGALADETGSPSNGPDGDPTKMPNSSLVTLSVDPSARRWGGQFRADYADEFDALTGIGGQLILESTSRFGFDASARIFANACPAAMTI